MKVWITKYALMSGIYSVDAEECQKDMIRTIPEGKWSLASYFHGEGKTWHRTEGEAVCRAKEIRDRKIWSLKKQITKLEKMKFD
jgi:hypothetical protein